jgi:hypothetical protein
MPLITSFTFPQEMMKESAGLRTGPKNSYHDKVFEEEINNLINITNEQYEKYVVPPFPFDAILIHLLAIGHSTKTP